jgi:cytochrome c oxidase assembly factor CtaG
MVAMDPKPRRRWFQFSLRTLFAAALFLTALIALWSSMHRAALDQLKHAEAAAKSAASRARAARALADTMSEQGKPSIPGP